MQQPNQARPGIIPKNITTAFALIGLYLALEQGYSGWQVQQAHMALAARRKEWPRFEPPSQTGRLNVLDVLLVRCHNKHPAGAVHSPNVL